MRCLRTPWTLSRMLGRGTTALVCAGVAGCSNIEPIAPTDAPVTDPAQLYRRLKLEDAAINLSTVSPYNTIQLRAIPRNALGEAMAGLPAPTYRLQNRNDSVRVRVTPDGLVTAAATTTGIGVQVIASLTSGLVTHFDTARIVVKAVADPPKLASLAIDPIFPDSAIWSVPSTTAGGALKFIFSLIGIENITPPQPRAVDSIGNSIAGLTYEYESLDPSVANFGGWAELNRKIHQPGQFRRVARTHAYGISLADTVPYTVTPPIVGTLNLTAAIASAQVSRNILIAPYGHVAWSVESPGSGIPGDTVSTTTGDTIDVVFDDTTHVEAALPEICLFLNAFGLNSSCSGGNAVLVDNDTAFLMIRQFPEPGIYRYHSVRNPEFTGRVIVTTDPYAILGGD